MGPNSDEIVIWLMCARTRVTQATACGKEGFKDSGAVDAVGETGFEPSRPRRCRRR